MGLFKKLSGNGVKPESNESISITLGGKTITFDEKTKERFALENQALQAYDSKQYQTAINIYNRIIAGAPDEQMYYTRRGTVYEDMGDDVNAKKDFLKALQMKPDDYLAQFRLGMLYSREKNLEKAVEWLRKSYRNTSTYQSVMGNVYNNVLFVHKRVIAYNLGNFLNQLGQKQEGMKILDEVIANCPDYSYPHFSKGLTYFLDGNLIEAEKCMKKAQSLGHSQAGAALSELIEPALALKRSNSVNATDDSLNDKYSRMVENTSFNPFNITTNRSANQNLRFDDLTEVFTNELNDIFCNFSSSISMEIFDQMLSRYTFNMIESYYKNAGFVPKKIMDMIIEQVFKAAGKTICRRFWNANEFENFRYKMYYSLTHR